MKLLKENEAVKEEQKRLLKRCSEAIKTLEPSASIILYGSRARGDNEAESDYDLLILTDQKATLEREDIFRRQLFPVEIETGSVFTVMLVSRKDWHSDIYQAMPFHQNIERDGTIL